jgi:hypothetical protein
MRYLVIILVLFCFSFGLSDAPGKLRLFSYQDAYNWNDCVKPSKAYTDSEIPKLIKHFNDFIANQDSLENYFHFIDLNGDKKLDAIYSGGTGAANEYVVFLLNTGDDYKILFEEYTNIRELVFKKGRLVGYTGLDFGCCAEYVEKETKYEVTENWQKIIIYQRAQTSYTIQPKNIFEKPIKFVVAKDIYKLRSSPIVDDTSMFIYDTISNVVSTYVKGSVGYAWSEISDNSGRLWWFVEMEPNNRQIGSRISANRDTIPVRNLGWMSSRFLQKIE